MQLCLCWYMHKYCFSLFAFFIWIILQISTISHVSQVSGHLTVCLLRILLAFYRQILSLLLIRKLLCNARYLHNALTVFASCFYFCLRWSLNLLKLNLINLLKWKVQRIANYVSAAVSFDCQIFCCHFPYYLICSVFCTHVCKYTIHVWRSIESSGLYFTALFWLAVWSQWATRLVYS